MDHQAINEKEFAVVCDKVITSYNRDYVGFIVKGGKIHILLKPEEIHKIRNITILDYRGNTVVPGLIDPHNHMLTTVGGRVVYSSKEVK